jgi:thiamine-phosphate pyrophosphorylase
MNYQFTSGAERALFYAAGCISPVDYAELAAPAILLGLLAESECRAALLLAQHGITTNCVRNRWPGMLAFPPNGGIPLTQATILLNAIDHSLQLASQMVKKYIHPPILATEHLLLGLLLADEEISSWLNQQGLRWEEIEADMRARHGYQADAFTTESPPLDFIGEEEMQIKNGKLKTEVNTGQWAVDSGQCESAARPSTPKSVEPSALKSSGFIHPSSFIPHPSTLSPHSSPLATLRIIDAAANRAREGLRVAEDYVRFVLDDRHLTEQCKQLRHDLSVLLSRIPSGQLLAARETQVDVGTELSTPGEEHRADPGSVVLAGFARLQESLRSLEEYGKLIEPNWAAEIKQLRYRSYTLHRAVEITRGSIERLTNARLYVLTDGRSSLGEFRELAQAIITAGVHVIQLRDKNLDDRQLLQRGRLLRELIRGDCPDFRVNENGTVPFAPPNTLFIMNDRPDLAALCQADGVHLGRDDVSIKDARSIVGPDALIGLSTHTIEQARQAVLDGANYIGVGPTFPSGTKEFDQYPGLELLRAVAAEIRLPAFAIGGITPGNLSQVLSTGITRVALSGAIGSASDPTAVVHELLEKLQNGGH